STVKKRTTPELGKMEGKKIALIEVDGEASSQAIVEVALVNQLLKHGSFILIEKKEVEAAKSQPDLSPLDWKGIARRAGGDYALRAKIIAFEGKNREGYSSQTVEDSQLAAERGENARKTERMYKVKSLEGTVQVQLEFADVTNGDLRSAIAEKTETVTAEAKDSAAHLPLKLKFLEKLANEAFRQFFEQYN
ncbi:MAG: hypothetical protein AABZ55_07585, partial [Bdellovibrionota bacterium]